MLLTHMHETSFQRYAGQSSKMAYTQCSETRVAPRLPCSAGESDALDVHLITSLLLSHISVDATHTHTHTDTHTHTHTQTYFNVYTRTRTYTHIDMRTYTPLNAYTHVREQDRHVTSWRHCLWHRYMRLLSCSFYPM